MQKIFKKLFSLFLLVLLFLPFFISADYFLPLSGIEGVIRDKDTNQPIEGVWVYFLFEITEWEYLQYCDYNTCLQVGDKYFGIFKATQTDENGFYHLEIDGAGEVAFLARKSGYRDFFQSNLYLPPDQIITSNILLEKDIPEWRKDIQIGDILYDPYSIGGFGHTAIYVGDGYVIEAQGNLKNKKESKVKKNPIISWDYPNRKSVILLRVKTTEEIKRKAIEFAISQAEPAGKPYDFNWFQKNPNPDAPSWYCSELVWASYYNQGVNIDYYDEVTKITQTSDGEKAYFDHPIPPKYIYRDSDTFEVARHMEDDSSPIKRLFFYIFSPVEVIIKDGQGNVLLNREAEAIPFGYYTKELMENGEVADKLVILEPQGEYFVEVWPRPDTKPEEEFTILVEYEGNTIPLFESEKVNEFQPKEATIKVEEQGLRIEEKKSVLREKIGESKIVRNKFSFGSLRIGFEKFLKRVVFLWREKETQKIKIKKLGSLDFKYQIRGEQFKGELCKKIRVRVKSQNTVLYYGNLKDLKVENFSFPENKELVFEYQVPRRGFRFLLRKRKAVPFLKGYCRFSLVFEAWQKNFESFGEGGFWDRKKTRIVIISPLWRRKPPLPPPIPYSRF